MSKTIKRRKFSWECLECGKKNTFNWDVESCEESIGDIYMECVYCKKSTQYYFDGYNTHIGVDDCILEMMKEIKKLKKELKKQ